MMKKYLVPIIGGMSNYYMVYAENKTQARRMAQGEVQPWIKVKGKIIEVKENEEVQA